MWRLALDARASAAFAPNFESPARSCCLQMASNDVGSLLVYDKDKVGPGGAIPQTVDACVGIITERGELF